MFGKAKQYSLNRRVLMFYLIPLAFLLAVLFLYLNVYHRHKPGLTDGNACFVCIDIMQFDEEERIIPTVMTHEWTHENGKAEISE